MESTVLAAVTEHARCHHIVRLRQLGLGEVGDAEVAGRALAIQGACLDDEFRHLVDADITKTVEAGTSRDETFSERGH